MDENEDCAVKHCDEPGDLGMTIVLAGLRIELYLCQPHFDLLDAALGRDNNVPREHS